MKRKMGVTALALGLIFGLSACTDDFKDSCTASDGRILSDSSSVTGISGGGQVTTSTVKVRLCIVQGDVVDMEVS